ncbi:MAG TPA: TIGR03435 family protein [Candidatus Sulfopaludibacter sp.]|nr:TIGR03435 family protein [Candidatus Sulfopaludibacter sp.]
MWKLTAALTLGACIASAQTFDVSSIKRNTSGAANSGFRRFTGGALDATNITLKSLIAFAWEIPQDQIVDASGWVDTERYDVVAKPDRTAAGADNSMAAIRLRTRALLADRFKLDIRKETRQLPVFSLVVAKGGPLHLQPPKGTSPDLFSNGHHVTCVSASMAFFAKVFLTGQAGRPVEDKTGVQGQFDFSLDWAPDEVSPADTAAPSLFTALQEQLGLKLEAGKGPVEVLVLAHAERPSAN